MGSQEAHYIPLSEARPYVQQRLRFVAPNAHGVWYEKLYLVRVQTPEVYHISLFVYDKDTERWFENITEYNNEIYKHKMQLNPHTDTIPMGETGIIDLIMTGSYKQLVKERVNG